MQIFFLYIIVGRLDIDREYFECAVGGLYTWEFGRRVLETFSADGFVAAVQNGIVRPQRRRRSYSSKADAIPARLPARWLVFRRSSGIPVVRFRQKYTYTFIKYWNSFSGKKNSIVWIFGFIYSCPLVAVGQPESTSKDVNVRRHIQIFPVPEFVRALVVSSTTTTSVFIFRFVTGLENFMAADKFPLRTPGILWINKIEKLKSFAWAVVENWITTHPRNVSARIFFKKSGKFTRDFFIDTAHRTMCVLYNNTYKYIPNVIMII